MTLWVALTGMTVVPEKVAVEAVAVSVIVEVPLGVGKLVFPPQAESPVSEASRTTTAAHCIRSRRRAFLAPAKANRSMPRRRPDHQGIAVGVTTGA